MAISLVATTQPSPTSSTTSAALNCAAGGNWSATPQAGDLMIVVLNYGDDSGVPNLSGAPAGWTQISVGPIGTDLAWYRGIFYRVASASETSYSFTSINNGQISGLFQFQGACLRGAANPVVFDPGASVKNNQADTLNQASNAAVVTQAGTALIGVWSQNWLTGAANYVSVATINGVTATLLTVTDQAPPAPAEPGVFALALWLAPGIGTWTPTATRTPTGSPSTWNADRFGIEVAPPVSASPQRTLVGTGT